MAAAPKPVEPKPVEPKQDSGKKATALTLHDTAALVALLGFISTERGPGGVSYEIVAARAWEAADAFMHERRKKGYQDG